MFTSCFFLLHIKLISSSSSILSTFICFIFLLIANSISSQVFPTPENTTLLGSTPFDRDFCNSPAETTSTPELSFDKTWIIEHFDCFDIVDKF